MCIVVWDREDYLAEAVEQLGDENVYERVLGNSVSPLMKTIKSVISQIDKRGDISRETLDYFLINNPKLGRFYLLPKIHKRLHSVPCLLYTSPSPRDGLLSRMPSSA